jgi:hypothetical protein
MAQNKPTANAISEIPTISNISLSGFTISYPPSSSPKIKSPATSDFRKTGRQCPVHNAFISAK